MSDMSTVKSRNIKQSPLSAPKSLYIYRSAYKNIISNSQNNNNSTSIIMIDDSHDPLSIHKIKIPPKNTHKNGILPLLPSKYRTRNTPSTDEKSDQSTYSSPSTDTMRYAMTNYRTKKISLILDGINENSDSGISHFSLYAQFLKEKRNSKKPIPTKNSEGDIIHIDSHLSSFGNNMRRSKSTHRLPSQIRPNRRKEMEGRDPITFKPRRRTSLIRRAKLLPRKQLPPPPKDKQGNAITSYEQMQEIRREEKENGVENVDIIIEVKENKDINVDIIIVEKEERENEIKNADMIDEKIAEVEENYIELQHLTLQELKHSPKQSQIEEKIDVDDIKCVDIKIDNDVLSTHTPRSKLEQPFRTWDSRHVSEWIQSIIKPQAKDYAAFVEYGVRFFREQITGEDLISFLKDKKSGSNVLREDLDIHRLIHRKTIFHAVQEILDFEAKKRNQVFNKCLKCGKDIENDFDKLKEEDGYYHWACFSCDQCEKPLGGITYVEYDDEDIGLSKLCQQCLQNVFSVPDYSSPLPVAAGFNTLK